MEFGHLLDAILNWQVLTAWWYTISRSVLLLAILITLWHGRRYPWLLTSLGLATVIVGLRVLADVLLDGADRPFSVYAVLTNLSTLLIYIAVNHLISQLARRRMAERQRDVAIAQRNSARAMVHQYQERLGEPLIVWPEDKGAP